VVDETAEHLARGLAGVIWSFDPEVVILSGPVVRDCPSLISATRAILGALEAARRFDVPLVAATEESDTGVVAASAIVSLRYVEDLANAEQVGTGDRLVVAR
jgi:predicted NBD/HSP70 family sugar kinase